MVGARHANGPGDSSGRAFFIDLTTDTVTTIDPGDLDISSTFGTDVAIDGDVAVIGAPTRNGVAGADVGKIYIYELVTGTWTLTGEFEGSVADSQFGRSVDVDGLRVAAGTLFNTGTGFVQVYDKSGTWALTDTITAPGSNDQFGIEVALDADRLLIGAPGGDYVESHTFDGVSWNLEQTLTSSTLPGVDSFGYGLALDGPVALIGALRTDIGTNTYQGAGFLFTLTGGTWTETDVYLAADGAALDSFGSDVVIDGTTALLSAPTDDNSNGPDSGAVYTFDLVVPAPDGRIYAPDAEAGDLLRAVGRHPRRLDGGRSPQRRWRSGGLGLGLCVPSRPRDERLGLRRSN